MSHRKGVTKLNIEYKRVGEVEHLTASGTPKEIASLVLELQGRRVISVVGKKEKAGDREALAEAILEMLQVQNQEHSSPQQPSPTGHTQSQDEGHHPGGCGQQSDTPQHL